MLTCQKCKKQNPDHAIFCSYCGSPLDRKPSSPSSSPDREQPLSSPELRSMPRSASLLSQRQATDLEQASKTPPLSTQPVQSVSQEQVPSKKKKPRWILGAIVFIILLVVVSAFLIVKFAPGLLDSILNKEKELAYNTEDQEQEGIEDNIQVNPLLPQRSMVVCSASSVLQDITEGTSYNVENIIDVDLSTSWAEARQDEGIGEWVQFTFGSNAGINTLGVFAGKAKDEETYFQNNRVQDFELEFSDGEKISGTLDDKYTIQFITFNVKQTSYLKFIIKSVYRGTKHNDTCISEIDLWSDWVINKDSDAAMQYYKEDSGEISTDYVIDAYMTFDLSSDGYPESARLSSYAYDMPKFVATVELSPSTPEDTKFTVKWYKGDEVFFTDTRGYNGPFSDGKCFASSIALLTKYGADEWSLGDYKVEWILDDKVVRTVEFKVNVQ